MYSYYTDYEFLYYADYEFLYSSNSDTRSAPDCVNDGGHAKLDDDALARARIVDRVPRKVPVRVQQLRIPVQQACAQYCSGAPRCALATKPVRYMCAPECTRTVLILISTKCTEFASRIQN